MLKKIIITSVAAAGLLLSVHASADQSTYKIKVWDNNAQNIVTTVKPNLLIKPQPTFGVNKEQRQQATMISQGIKTCKITPTEAKVLNKQQKKIQKTEQRLRQDGLSRWETNLLQTSLKSARIQINKLTKNRSTCGRSKRKLHNSKRIGSSYTR